MGFSRLAHFHAPGVDTNHTSWFDKFLANHDAVGHNFRLHFGFFWRTCHFDQSPTHDEKWIVDVPKFVKPIRLDYSIALQGQIE